MSRVYRVKTENGVGRWVDESNVTPQLMARIVLAAAERCGWPPCGGGDRRAMRIWGGEQEWRTAVGDGVPIGLGAELVRNLRPPRSRSTPRVTLSNTAVRNF